MTWNILFWMCNCDELVCTLFFPIEKMRQSFLVFKSRIWTSWVDLISQACFTRKLRSEENVKGIFKHFVCDIVVFDPGYRRLSLEMEWIENQ